MKDLQYQFVQVTQWITQSALYIVLSFFIRREWQKTCIALTLCFHSKDDRPTGNTALCAAISGNIVSKSFFPILSHTTPRNSWRSWNSKARPAIVGACVGMMLTSSGKWLAVHQNMLVVFLALYGPFLNPVDGFFSARRWKVALSSLSHVSACHYGCYSWWPRTRTSRGTVAACTASFPPRLYCKGKICQWKCVTGHPAKQIFLV